MESSDTANLRRQLGDFLGFRIPEGIVVCTTHAVIEAPDYHRIRISYTGDAGDEMTAWLASRACAELSCH